MPLPDFILKSDLNLDTLSEQKFGEFRDAVIARVDEFDAELQQRLQEAYSGGIVNQVSGKAARSVEAIPATVEGDTVSGRVQAGGGTAYYVQYLEEGTAPHEIVASGRALAFQIGGAQVFAKKVHHPGTKAYAIVEHTFEDMREEILHGLEAIPEEIFG